MTNTLRRATSGARNTAENNVQLALEWRAPEDGTADVSFELIGRNHANTDIEWHLATSTAPDPWNDLGFIAVTQAHSPASPAGLGLGAACRSASKSS